jgi:hypothetical protein
MNRQGQGTRSVTRVKRRKANPARDAFLDRLSRLSLFALLISAILAIVIPSLVLDGAGRLVKALLAALLSLVPGWIYLLFIKNKGASLYDEYVLNLFRLRIDEYQNLPAPPQHTTFFALWNEENKKLRSYLVSQRRKPTKDNLYRKKFEAVYGRGAVSTFQMLGTRRQVGEFAQSFSAVLLTTVLFCLGWALVLPPDLMKIFSLRSGIAGRTFPNPFPFEALRYAFMGLYAFTLQDLVRRYFRDDLRAGAYIAVVGRILLVQLVVAAASPLWGGQIGLANAVAFVVGFFPQAGLQFLMDTAQKPLGRALTRRKSRYPLNEIDGLNIWYEARLSEEGIEDMQNLVSANLVDLMLRTRAPVARLVDWIDQAFLHLYVNPGGSRKSSRWRAQEQPDLPVERFRALGIRNASGLIEAWERLQDDSAFRKQVNRAWGVETDGTDTGRVDAILLSLAGEANMRHVRAFRQFQRGHLTQDETAEDAVPPTELDPARKMPHSGASDLRRNGRGARLLGGPALTPAGAVHEPS